MQVHYIETNENLQSIIIQYSLALQTKVSKATPVAFVLNPIQPLFPPIFYGGNMGFFFGLV